MILSSLSPSACTLLSVQRQIPAGNVTWNYPQSLLAPLSTSKFHTPTESEDNLGWDFHYLCVCVYVCACMLVRVCASARWQVCTGWKTDILWNWSLIWKHRKIESRSAKTTCLESSLAKGKGGYYLYKNLINQPVSTDFNSLLGGTWSVFSYWAQQNQYAFPHIFRLRCHVCW